MGAELSLVWTLPFAGILLSIALFPLFAPHFWHHHFRKISIAWAVFFSVPFLFAYGSQAFHEIVHIYVVDYIPFIILLGALFTISGGILVRGSLSRVPWLNNALIILVGTMIASWVGTTGASMLLIRPILRANSVRRYKVHTVVFFIFLVSNIGGTLTPLGDPPLFLGFLHSVPFFWTLQNLWIPFFFTIGLLLAIYTALDCYLYCVKESPEVRMAAGSSEPVKIEGMRNFLLLGGVIGGVLLSGSWNPDHINLGGFIKHGQLVILEEGEGHSAEVSDSHTVHPGNGQDGVQEAPRSEESSNDEASDGHEGGHHGLGVPLQNVTRDVLLIILAIVSLVITPKGVRAANGYSWFPIKEVAWLFAGIFMTIIPALKILSAGKAGALGPMMDLVTSPAHYYWITGVLSSFLDNAPTYLTFFNTALGRFSPGAPSEAAAVAQLIAEQGDYLIGISLGAVFMGANTYIGNAPNFMVKSIAEESGIRMPDFISYIWKYSLPILIPVFVLVTVVFF